MAMPGSRPHRHAPFRHLLTAVLVALPAFAHAAFDPASRVVYVSPAPGAALVQPASHLIVRFDRAPGVPAGAFAIGVTGAVSGVHAGTARFSDDGRTLLFAPAAPFARGERVEVRVVAPDGGTLSVFSFTTSAVEAPRARAADPVGVKQAGGTFFAAPRAAATDEPLPSDFPQVSLTNYGTPDPGTLFLGCFAWGGQGAPYLMMLDGLGTPLWYRNTMAMDFKQQPNGWLTYYDFGAGVFYALGPTLATVDSFACGNGYSTDLHELRLLPDGHALLMSYDPEVVDMSQVVPTGQPDAVVTGLIVQELDASKNVVFQWRSWDHFEITDAVFEDLAAAQIDYVHGNAIEVDTDGNLLISSRHMDEITKIDRTTGDVIWRWGGKHNEFTFTGDPLPFSHQHAIRLLPNGHYTLFDNGNGHMPVQFSRALEYSLDQQNKVANVEWEYRHAPDLYGQAMGYVQRLPSGNTLVSWGAAEISATEVDPAGNVLMELTLPQYFWSYRVFLEDWSTPAAVDAPDVRAPLALAPAGPNPFHGRTGFVATVDDGGKTSYALYGVTGRDRSRALRVTPLAAGRSRLDVDLSDAPPGVYFLRVASGRNSVTRRLLNL